MRSTACSAPGKAILMGEHAAVYDRPALVVAIGLRTTVAVTEGGPGVAIDLESLGWRGASSWEGIRAKTGKARAEWRRFVEAGGPWRPSDSGDPARLVTIALGEAADALGLASPPDMSVTIASRIPPGSGFGSSAALSVALAGAFSLFVDAGIDGDVVAAVAREVERRQHGTPSGVDAAAAQRGGLLWARREPDGGVSVETLVPHAPAFSGFGLFHTGSPEESTGEVVGEVRRRLAADRALTGALGAIEQATRSLRHALEGPNETPPKIVEVLRDGESALERLGVVPAAVAAVIRSVERSGGAAKVSGAGATRGDRAGAVIVYHPDRSWLDDWPSPAGWRRIRAPLAVEGLRPEEST